MAELLASAIVSRILGNLASSSLKNQITLLSGFKDDLNDLKSKFSTLQSVLKDAEMQPRKSAALENWLQKIRDAAYDAQNILDDLQHRADSQRGKSCLFLRKSPLFRFKMVRKVKSVGTKLDAISEERTKFHLTEGVVENRFGVTLGNRNTCSVIETEPYGRQEEMEKIMEKLLDDERLQDDLSVYAIWGMGGIGKTTLAQMVYNEVMTKNDFDLTIWVCVSDDFTVERLVMAIIEKIDGRRSNLSELDPLQCHLRKGLMGKKFLLVLDDVWNDNPGPWDKLKSILRCGLKGSVLLVTTRKKNVASMMATVAPHEIRCLNEEDSWSLFQRRAFSTGVNDDLVSIGKEIVKKCGGVPLAINALSSVMSTKTEESEWLAIEKNEIWSLLDNKNGISHILKLSYYDLPPDMRQCFAYCCIFPKDSEMEVDQLIQLWMANDFIHSSNQEDVLLSGRSIFKELVGRCFFQDVKENYKGKRTCKMHDLMHDLAASVMRNETYILEDRKELNTLETPRHLALLWHGEERIELPNVDSLRSIRVRHIVYDEGVSSFISKQKYVRALDLGFGREPKMVNLVCKLKHLKYLAMSCLGITILPESLTRLRNLQTLKLANSAGLVELPKNLKVMKKLWFLEIDYNQSLVCMPPSLGDLTCLRRLSVFIVGPDAPQQINQLKELNKLEGELVIKGLENVINLKDAESSNLVAKRNLTSLSLIWAGNHNNKPPQHFEEVLEGLKPHHNIERVLIKCFHGSKLPNWMGNLRCLTNLTIGGCPKLDTIPFPPSLKELQLYGCNAALLTSIRNLVSLKSCELHCSGDVDILPDDLLQGCEFLLKLRISGSGIRSVSNVLDHLPSLTELNFLYCRNLEVLPKDLCSLCSLENLKFYRCESLTTFPAIILEGLPSLKRLSLRDCDKLKPLSGHLNRALPLLRCLYIEGLRELECLPESMQQLTSLKTLIIAGCDGLLCLPDWLGCLHSLSVLSFRECKKLRCLPDSFKILMSLRSLEIRRCPELENRCKKAEGEDWPKISHIPTIIINGINIQQN